jgi:SAM-dependent methyltransferase
MMYDDEYFTGDDAEHGAHSSTDYETAAIQGSVKFPEILGWIKKYHTSGDFFEIGCGMGYFLKYAKDNGFRVSGIEFSAFGTQAAKEKFGLDVKQGSLDTISLNEQSYDVVFLGDVLEHMVEPIMELERIKKLLRTKGIVAIEVPSSFNSVIGRAASAIYRLQGKQRYMKLPPYHVNEFTPSTIAKALEFSGYKNIRIVQRIKKPSAITLRGSLVDKIAKKYAQYPNYWITKSFKIFGDRILAIGVKE